MMRIIRRLLSGDPSRQNVKGHTGQSWNNPAGNEQTERINCLFCNSTEAITFRHRADIVKCGNCGVVYLRTRPTQEAMYRIYQDYARDGSHMRPPDSVAEAKVAGLRRKALIDEIITFTGENKGVWLDVGCGWGAFLDEARDRAFTPKGIEITRNCLDFATMQLQIPVSNSQFLDSRIDNGSCRVVSMVHVLEHLPYPGPTLKKIYDILEEGGMFCGIVPNIASWCSDQLKEDWVWLDPTHHYVHYSPETLTKALEDAGFTISRMYTATGDFEHAAIVSSVMKNFPDATTTEKAWARIATLEEQGKGEEIRFFARKNK